MDDLNPQGGFSVNSGTQGSTPLASGLYLANLTNDQLQLVGLFFNEIYEKVRTRARTPRQVTRNALTMLTGAMFALGSQKSENIEWKEHCASSLREVLHEWEGNGHDFSSEFREYYPNSPKSTETESYKQAKLYYQYFSGIGHHNASGILSSLSALKKSSTLKLEDCYKDDVFVETVKGFFICMAEIIEHSKRTSSAEPTTKV